MKAKHRCSHLVGTLGVLLVAAISGTMGRGFARNHLAALEQCHLRRHTTGFTSFHRLMTRTVGPHPGGQDREGGSRLHSGPMWT